tara:strand:+ start:100 stop:483 length:384 start_codon:yes stop_codon:yes gene_type:complete
MSERQETIDRLVSHYGFKDEDALWEFGQSMENPKVKIRKMWIDEEGMECDESAEYFEDKPWALFHVLYTDCDGGFMEITRSEMFEEEGFKMENVLCSYVDLHHNMLFLLLDVVENPEQFTDKQILDV